MQLIHAELSEARNRAALATSSGVPSRRIGWFSRSDSCTCSGICCLFVSVMIVSGAMQLTRMPLGPACGGGDGGAWVWAARGGRGDGDDFSVSSLLHPGEEAFDRQEGRGQVGID